MEKQEQCRCGSSKEDRRYYIINLLDVFVYNCCDHDGNFAKNNVSKGEKKMLVKDLLEQTKESVLIERSIQLTELPYDIVNTRASRRKAEKQLQKKYKKLIAAIL